MGLKVGDTVWSPFLGRDIKIVKINSDDDWYFEIEDVILKAQTSLSYFEEILNGDES
jgi:hypothetical protein